MSYVAFQRVGAQLSPQQVTDLQTIFDGVCFECLEDRSSKVANECAAVLIRSAQRGILDHEMLRDIGKAVLRRH
ncbi:hypothetical protein G6L37_19170 [Agrobacterium rubi]|uniref:Uncharacterized protein n=1 Tax=Agrobacterium rubi TaxID=28099 RepID=A0AAE7R230_9HYPH|nr:hypothetical protein [Agrobacterium rubi]NTF03098.1 hypothetical protein [Agrobacterium rubi]NTF08293.1 hypothetical protein [Agrobacterium rubi]NTF20521.1 hypothetical protein [Agrobacterium rubi]NTF27492.1 hypothetical protein [Agrobacterium rubi]